MSTAEIFDVVIVGGGPAGATAAYDLAKLGRKILLLDKAGRIKPCGGAIPPRAIRDFGKHFLHVHAKDARIDLDPLYQHGIMGLAWHTPKLPGMGDVNWGKFFSTLTDCGYRGSVCVEVEDRAYEGSLNDRIASLQQSYNYLRNFVPQRRTEE